MPADSEPQDEYDHSLNWVMVGEAKQGGSEMGKYPHIRRIVMLSPSLMQNYSHSPEKGASPPIEGWLHTLHSKQQKTRISQETRIDSQCMRMFECMFGWWVAAPLSDPPSKFRLVGQGLSPIRWPRRYQILP